jgi:integral membrane protein (TIGR01906 family)
MRRVEVWFAALAFAVLAVALPLAVLESASVTRTLVDAYASPQSTNLPSERIAVLAEQVREFVVRGSGELPAQVDGRAGFDRASVSHLVDVRVVLRSTRIASGLIAAALAVWVGWSVSRRRFAEIGSALRAGALTTATVSGLAVLAAVTDFDAFFSAFHGLFFKAGTWTFSYDSLLIQLFPEPFWATLGAAWGVLVALMAVGYWVSGTMLRAYAFAQSA